MAEEKQNPEVQGQIRIQDRQEQDWQPGDAPPSEVDVSGLADLFHDLRFPADKAEVLQRVAIGRTFHIPGPGESLIQVDLNRLIVQMDKSHFPGEYELLEAIREAIKKELHPELGPPSDVL